MDDLKQRLVTLSQNLWWSWCPEGRQFWSDFGGSEWAASSGSPTRLLQMLDESEVSSRVYAMGVQRLNDLSETFEAYMSEKDTWHALEGSPIDNLVAYFSAEYGIHESMPNYSGGLGILAGDHVKSASDLGLPFVAVGLLYRNGYVRQEIDALGQQVA